LVETAYLFGFPFWFRVRPTLFREFPQCVAHYPYPLPELPSNRSQQGLPSSCHFSTRIPRSKVDPGSPSEISPYRFLCVGFWTVNTIADCFIHVIEAVSSFRECGLPCGLRVSLCTLQRLRSVAFIETVILGGLNTFVSSQCPLSTWVIPKLHLSLPPSLCNTRYEWLVRPYSAGTFTPQEAPSFAWRTNGPSSPGRRPILVFKKTAGRRLRWNPRLGVVLMVISDSTFW
jgi:hypothetical protein